MSVLVVLIGTRGAGKSTALQFLRDEGVVVLTPSTSRPPRMPGESEYFFEDNWAEVDLVWEIAVDQHKYGMRRSEIERVIQEGLGATVFEPGEVLELERFKAKAPIEVVTIGLDTVESIEDQVERIGGDASRARDERKLRADREVVSNCDAVFSGDSTMVGDAVLASCRLLGSRGGVVDGNAIKSFLRGGTLLTEASEANVQSASYDLRLGPQAWCQGEYVTLDEKNPTLKIPAYSYAIVTAQEEGNLPRFVTGRYDLTVSGFMDGLILSNGPQVDPGYQGSLFCMLFNGSDLVRGVTLGKHFATMEFVTTTMITEGYSGKYQGRKGLAAFVSQNTAASPGGNIVKRIDGVEGAIQKRATFVNQVVFGSLAVVVAIHLALAGWLWFGGPNLAAWLTGCKDSPAGTSRGEEKNAGGFVGTAERQDPVGERSGSVTEDSDGGTGGAVEGVGLPTPERKAEGR